MYFERATLIVDCASEQLQGKIRQRSLTMLGMKFETRSRGTTAHLPGDKVHSVEKASNIGLKGLSDYFIRSRAFRVFGERQSGG